MAEIVIQPIRPAINGVLPAGMGTLFQGYNLLSQGASQQFGIANPFESINSLAEQIQDGEFWLNTVGILVGIVLVIIAVVYIVKSD